MGTSQASAAETVWELPPLILHPFNERVPPSALLENSRAALILSGLVKDEKADREELRRRLVAGRYAEVRMLYFLGRDVLRWIEQCVETVERGAGTASNGMAAQTFARLLTADPPRNVKDKLMRWGVADYASIFSRAIGLNAIFATPPEVEQLAEEFLRSYHRYADAMYECYMESQPYAGLAARDVRLELYASGEYSRLLESEWGTG